LVLKCSLQFDLVFSSKGRLYISSWLMQ
jgi:hypothetical protein